MTAAASRAPASVRVVHAYLSQLPGGDHGTIKISVENISVTMSQIPTNRSDL